MEGCPQGQGQGQNRSRFWGPDQTRGITSEVDEFWSWARVNQSLTHPGTVTLGWSLNISVLQFRHLWNGDNNPTISTELFWWIDEYMQGALKSVLHILNAQKELINLIIIMVIIIVIIIIMVSWVNGRGRGEGKSQDRMCSYRPSYGPKEMKTFIHKNPHTGIFIVAKKWKQPKWLSAGGWINRM